MGALLLRTLLLALVLGACAPQGPDGREADTATGTATAPARTAQAGRGDPRADPHAGITCSGCHSGGRADVGRASVPRTSCTASGCHEDGGAERVQLATATFEHRRHGEGGEIEPSCAGCHTHSDGGEPLRASVDACALCHLPQLASPASEDCQVCHQQTRHITLTSAGLPVPHANLPWLEIGCVRCHYDVADPPLEVAAARCAACHRDVTAVTRQGIGMDLHPQHSGVTCTGCHAAGAHQVREVSSAVELVCSDCHTQAHDLRLAPWEAGDAAWYDEASCSTCHLGVHRAQQQLLLGLLPDMRVLPADKFLSGMTCRSCHIPPPGGPPIQPIRGQALACRGCHEAGYERVLDWWLRGAAERLQQTTAYVQGARRSLGEAAPDTARTLLTAADRLLGLVREAGGQHNLELSDRIFRESLQHAQLAYRLSDRQAPPAPRLGSPPHLGLCSGCHYTQTPLDIRDMPRGFHERLLEARGDR